MTKQLLLSLSFYAFFLNGLLAQANLSLADCHSLKASFEPLVTMPATAAGVYSFVLEKEIRPNLWQKIKQVEVKKREVLFSDLPKATYRVTIISPAWAKNKKTKRYHRLLAEEKEKVSEANTFLSNTLNLELDEDCDFWYKTNTEKSIRKRQSPIVIYPNPGQDRLWVKWKAATPVKTLSLYNLTGMLLRKISTAGNHTELDISDLHPGIYLIKATNGKTTIAIERISVIR